MLRRTEMYREFERRWLSRPVEDISQNFHILEALWSEAVTLGVFAPADPLEGIEVDVRVARAWNCVPRAVATDRPSI